MDPTHLYRHVIRPTLDYLASIHEALDRLSARRLLLGTAMCESGLKYLRQLSDGPALGLWQMEPDSHDDIWAHYLFYRPELARHIERIAGQWPRGAHAMVGNLPYACAMARMQYWRSPAPLPKPGDAEGLAILWKSRYNTMLGAGKAEKAIPIFAEAIEITKEDK